MALLGEVEKMLTIDWLLNNSDKINEENFLVSLEALAQFDALTIGKHINYVSKE